MKSDAEEKQHLVDALRNNTVHFFPIYRFLYHPYVHI